METTQTDGTGQRKSEWCELFQVLEFEMLLVEAALLSTKTWCDAKLVVDVIRQSDGAKTCLSSKISHLTSNICRETIKSGGKQTISLTEMEPNDFKLFGALATFELFSSLRN